MKPKSTWNDGRVWCDCPHKDPAAVCTRHEHCKPSYGDLDSTNSRNWIYLLSKCFFFIWLIISWILSLLSAVIAVRNKTIISSNIFFSVMIQFFSTLFVQSCQSFDQIMSKNSFLLYLCIFIYIFFIEFNKYQIFSNMSFILFTITIFVFINYFISIMKIWIFERYFWIFDYISKYLKFDFSEVKYFENISSLLEISHHLKYF